MRAKKGISLIELIVTISIVAILAASSAGIIIPVVHTLIILPRDTYVRNIAYEILDIIIEGDAEAKGLRSSSTLTDTSDNHPAADYIMFSYGSLSQWVKIQTYIMTYTHTGKSEPPFFLGKLETNKVGRVMGPFSDVSSPTAPLIYIPYYISNNPDITVTGTDAEHPTNIFKYYKADGTEWIYNGDNVYEIKRVEISIKVTAGSITQTATSSVELKYHA